MNHLAAAIVRVAVLGLALAGYLLLPIASEDALGAGLLAFAGIVVVSALWAAVDGYRHAARTALLWWAAVAVVLAIGWWIVFAATNRDSSISFTELLAGDAGMVPFVIGLVLVPAAGGAALGGLVGRGRRDG